jgi:universal stress protein E
MRRIRRILVALREPGRPGPAVRRAAQLARATGAAVELFHAVVEPRTVVRHLQGRSFARHLSVEHSVEAARVELWRVARSRALQGCSVQVTALWGAPAHEAIVRRALAAHADLVITGSAARTLPSRLVLRNTDWELIRACPVPLLLVKRGHPRRQVVLAAVDPFHANAKPAGLDAQLLEAAAAVARLLKGELHAVHAYLPLGVAMAGGFDEAVAWDSVEAEEHHTRAVQRAFARLSAKSRIAPARRHLQMGNIATELAATARQVHAAVVVMGAVSRSRLSRWIIGSTAERVLDELDCDVLIIKPRDGRVSGRGRGAG